MYKAVKTVVANNNAAWSGLPAFANAYTAFNEKLSLLEQLSNSQTFALIGVRSVKEAKRKITAEKAYAISSSLAAYAVLTNNVELIDLMKIRRWDLLRGASVRMLQLLDLILSKANALVGDLDDFGVDQAVVDELQTLRDELEVSFTAPRNAIIERKVLTTQIKNLIREIDLLLKHQLDKLIVVLQEEHADLFITYQNARIIIDLRAKRGSSEPDAEDSGEGESNSGDYGV